MKKILVTGGCGFIGSNFVRRVLNARPDVTVHNLDALTYAGNLENLADLRDEPRYAFTRGDVCDEAVVEATFETEKPDCVIHFAAESHVDRSIMGSGPFVRTNVLGTQVLLDAARRHATDRFVMVSTDEVYGSLGPTGAFTETSPLHPSSPYAASKASADLLSLSYHHTHGIDVVVTRCSNNYGRYQFPEKLVPLMTLNALQDRPLPVYGDGQNVRDWLHVDDHCDAILVVAERGRAGEVYNIGGASEQKNIDMVKAILDAVGKPHDLIRFVTDRPGHDRRYATDFAKLKAELGWSPKRRFDEALPETVAWYVDHRAWWSRVLSKEYLTYYERQYEQRLA